MTTPYVTSGPVTGEQFYGRKELLTEVTSARHRAIYILGTRQIGKTSLLRQVETFVPAIFLDVQWAGGDVNNLARQARREVRRKRKAYPWLPADEVLRDADLFTILVELNDAAEEAGQKLWFLVDEAEVLIRIARSDPQVLHQLRGTIQNCESLRIVLVAAKRLSETNELTGAVGSPFLSGFATRYLGGLSEEEASALLRQTQSASPVEVDEKLLTHLISLADGHPLLLQLLGERLYEDGRLRPPTEGDIIGIIDQGIKVGVFPQDFAVLSPSERRLLKTVAEAKAPPADVNPAYIQGLLSLGLLRRSDGGYAVGNEFFARWLREYADWEAKSEVSEEGTLAMYTQSQLEPVLAAVRENRLALGEMERALDALRRLLRAWQREGVPLSPGAKHTLEKMAKALEKPAGDALEMRHQLELALPLIPGILVYKSELSSEVWVLVEGLIELLKELTGKKPALSEA